MFKDKDTFDYGIVTIDHLGIPGGVCDSDFTDLDATVVCRSKGFYSGASYPGGSLGITQAKSPMWMKDVVCVGTEGTLTDCTWDEEWGKTPEECPREESVAAVCYNDNPGRLICLIKEGAMYIVLPNHVLVQLM